MSDGVLDNQALGQSEAFLELQERISMAARTSRPVIFIGERGTGKELAAARLHMLSPRWSQPYVTLNCAALSPTLIESELFGHEAGAFTGALRQRKGRFEIADGGSLFLDEVANIPPPVQEKILRVVEYGQMERVGSSSGLVVGVRLIAATHADLPAMAARGDSARTCSPASFEVITLPPLRARRDDIPISPSTSPGAWPRRWATKLGRRSRTGPRCSSTMRPGNVRELKNVIERMVYRSGGEPIDDSSSTRSSPSGRIRKRSVDPPEGGPSNMPPPMRLPISSCAACARRSRPVATTSARPPSASA